jgi:hypothetical protein
MDSTASTGSTTDGVSHTNSFGRSPMGSSTLAQTHLKRDMGYGKGPMSMNISLENQSRLIMGVNESGPYKIFNSCLVHFLWFYEFHATSHVNKP